MKLKKSDIGKEVIIRSWSRDNRQIVRSTATLTKVGSVNITLNSTSYKIYGTNPFMVQVSEGHISDNWVKVYLSEQALIDESELLELRTWLQNVFSHNTPDRLTTDQLKRIKTIIQEV